jgi:hypothetical protein
MADEGKLREQAAIGRQAQTVLDNERYQSAYAKVEQFLLTSITDSANDETQLREDAHRQIRLLRKLRDVMKQEMITGDGATKELLRVKDPHPVMRMLKNVRR